MIGSERENIGAEWITALIRLAENDFGAPGPSIRGWDTRSVPGTPGGMATAPKICPTRILSMWWSPAPCPAGEACSGLRRRWRFQQALPHGFQQAAAGGKARMERNALEAGTVDQVAVVR